MIDTLRQDLRFARRTLLQSPGFTIVAVLALALGIGVNTAFFSIVNAVLLRPLDVEKPEQIVGVHDRFLRLGLPSIGVSGADFLDYAARKDLFVVAAASNGGSFNLTGNDAPERLRGQRVSAGYFDVFGVHPIRGRVFLAEEDRPGVNRVVLSHGLWKRRFDSDPKLIGRTIPLNGESYLVTGILPASFQLPFGQPVDLYVPLGLTPEQKSVQRRGAQFLDMWARLQPGVTPQQAQAGMNVLAKRMTTQFPNQYGGSVGWGILVTPLLDEFVGDLRPALWVLFGAVGFVLLIACANVANLLLARASARSKEMAVRASLGANQWRLVRQLLTESVLLSLVGGVLGLLLAQWAVFAMRSLTNVQLPRLADARIDGTVLFFTLVVSLLAGMLFGLAPALQTLHGNLHVMMNEGGRGGTAGAGRQRLRELLVAGEVALSLTLLVGAGLMIRSLLAVMDVHPGFDAQRVLTLQLGLPSAKYGRPEQMAAFYRTLLERIQSLPGVEAAGAVSSIPFSGNGSSRSFVIAGRANSPGEPSPHADIRMASSGYFAALKIPLKQGRVFDGRETATGQFIAVIDDVLAKAYWPKTDPIGQTLTWGGPNDKPMTVVGIVGNVKHNELSGQPKGAIYVPVEQQPQARAALAVRTAGDPNAITNAVRQAVLAVDSEQPVYDVATMEERLGNSVARRRFSVTLLAAFSGLALILAAVGLYGVMAYTITQRTPELGIRMALGAAQSDVLRLITAYSMRLTLIGIGVGLAASLVLTRFLSTLLYRVSTADPLTLVGVPILLAAVMLLAGYLPARRAARVDPLVALRHE